MAGAGVVLSAAEIEARVNQTELASIGVYG